MRFNFSPLKTLLGRENLPQRLLVKEGVYYYKHLGETCVMAGFSLRLFELNWAKEHLLTERKQSFKGKGSKFQFSRPDTRHSSILKMTHTGFPSGPGVEAALQCRGHWFNHWSRKVPHASGQLNQAWQLMSLCSGARKSMCPTVSAVQQEETVQWEAHVLRLDSSPCSPQVDKGCHAAAKTTLQPGINKCLYFKKMTRETTVP